MLLAAQLFADEQRRVVPSCGRCLAVIQLVSLWPDRHMFGCSTDHSCWLNSPFRALNNPTQCTGSPSKYIKVILRRLKDRVHTHKRITRKPIVYRLFALSIRGIKSGMSVSKGGGACGSYMNGIGWPVGTAIWGEGGNEEGHKWPSESGAAVWMLGEPSWTSRKWDDPVRY